MKLHFTPEADADLSEAYNWYRRRSTRLAGAFLDAVGVAVNSVRRFPLAYPVSYRHVRRVRLRRFPYALFYELAEDAVVIIGCFHLARDPQMWQLRGEE